MKVGNKQAVIFLGFIALAVGLGFVVAGSKEILNAQRSLSWAKAKGEILESKVVKENSGGSKSRARKSRKAMISYRYTVGDTAYTSDRAIFGTTIGLTAKLGLTRSAEEIARQFPAGKLVDVFHHPDKPEIAVLETGIKMETLAPVSFGCLFFIVGGIVIRRGLRDH